VNARRRKHEALSSLRFCRLKRPSVTFIWQASVQEGQRHIMSSRLSKTIAGIGIALLATATLLSPTAAHASTTPAWEPDAHGVGTITFYDSSGNQVSTGSITDAPLALYAVGSALPNAGDTKALLEYAQPNPSVTDTANWSVATVSAQATTFPVTGAGVPSVIFSLDANHPVVTGAAIDTAIQQDIFAFPNTGPSGDSFDGAVGCAYETVQNNPSTCTNTGYQNLYQIRLLSSGTGGNSASYDSADLMVDPSTGDWTQVYPAPLQASVTTTTTLTTTPSTSASQGASVTLTATIVASDSSSPPGTVQFKDNGVALGTPITVDTTGETAQYSSSSLLPGQHSFTAVFTATDTVTYGPSTSNTAAFLVDPVAKKPTISGTAQVGKTLTCNEATTLGEAATFEWKLNGTNASAGRTYLLPGSAAKKSVTCTATVRVTGGTPSSATSAAKPVAVGAALKVSKKPALSGPHKVGKAEKVNPGKWSPAATSYSYQWLLNGKAIKHATKSSYKLVKKDKGKKISCTVTAKKTGFTSGKATSAAVKVKS
jgi:hypothetical protein